MNQENHVEMVIKKDFFVKSRKDNIKDEFEFLSVYNLFDNIGSGQGSVRNSLQSEGERISKPYQSH